MSYKIDKYLKNIETPIYICEEELLEKNLKLLKTIQDKTDINILLALKGFAFSPLLNLISKYLKGCCASGLYEAKYAKEFVKGEIHTYSPAFKESEFEEITNLSNHIVFNNLSQLSKYKDKIKSSNSIGIRINPEVSIVEVDIYNPCGIYSRLGTTKKEFENGDKSLLKDIDGFHFHALCEQNSDALELVLKKLELNFKDYFKNLKWINFGGGHHITKEDYDIEKLIQIITDFKNRYPHLKIYMELGEAVGWQTGTLVGTILDITKNDIDIAILDVSAE
ncbi:MAG: carboxynorspermidine decarboxylase, partial [Campylobacterota bacterium]|nr:carboxynorspermidine decarboxylase [Campylobacterota bacterium]